MAKKKGKLVVMFVDIKPTFNSVDRGILIEDMRKKRIRKNLVVRCEEVLKKTVCRVRMGEEERGRFWTGREYRQGCPLSLC